MEKMNYEELDPGIRTVVFVLRNYDFETTDSGDGVTKPEGNDYPHVFMKVDPEKLISESHRLLRILKMLGLTVQASQIQASYDPVDQVAVLILIDVTDKTLKEAAK